MLVFAKQGKADEFYIVFLEYTSSTQWIQVRSSMIFYKETLWTDSQNEVFEDSLSDTWDRLFFARGLEWSNQIAIVDAIMTLPGSLDSIQTSHCFLWIDGFNPSWFGTNVKSARCYRQTLTKDPSSDETNPSTNSTAAVDNYYEREACQ